MNSQKETGSSPTFVMSFSTVDLQRRWMHGGGRGRLHLHSCGIKLNVREKAISGVNKMR